MSRISAEYADYIRESLKEVIDQYYPEGFSDPRMDTSYLFLLQSIKNMNDNSDLEKIQAVMLAWDNFIRAMTHFNLLSNDNKLGKKVIELERGINNKAIVVLEGTPETKTVEEESPNVVPKKERKKRAKLVPGIELNGQHIEAINTLSKNLAKIGKIDVLGKNVENYLSEFAKLESLLLSIQDSSIKILNPQEVLDKCEECISIGFKAISQETISGNKSLENLKKHVRSLIAFKENFAKGNI